MPSRFARQVLCRVLLACGLCATGAAGAEGGTRIAVSLADPTASCAAYYADLERLTAAAGGAWLQHLAAGRAPSCR